MANRKVDYLLIGGGLASANCARWLREEGAEGEVLLVGREPDAPYNRPECSKGYLRGEESREEPLFRPAEWWEEQGIELLCRTSVTGLDLETKTAKLSSKEEVEFGKALIATGANVRRLNVEGCELEEIHYLRTLGNADAIRASVAEAENVVLIGGSYIGCEVAASMTMLGKQATIVMQEERTLERGFGKRAGRFVEELLKAHGVSNPRRRRARALRGGGARGEGADARGPGAGGRRGRDRRGRRAGHRTCAARRVGDRRARRRALLLAAGELCSRACMRRGTCANTTRRSTASTSGSSTGTWRSTTARPRR